MSDREFMIGLQLRLREKIRTSDCGPFLAAIVTEEGEIVSEVENRVVLSQCSHAHAEMGAILEAEKKLGTYNLGLYNLTLYTTAEPCMMCAGGILWSGIRKVVFGVSTKRVQEITGFDEGVKTGWREGFEQRGITIVGPMEENVGEEILMEYMSLKKKVYNPSR